MIEKSAAVAWELLGVYVTDRQVGDVLEDRVAEADLPAVELRLGARVLVVVDGVWRAVWDVRWLVRIKVGVSKTTFVVHAMVGRDDDVVWDVVGGGVRGRGVGPGVLGAIDRSVELRGLAGKEDDGLAAVGKEVFNRELVHFRRGGREHGLELGEPAAECLASSIPVVFWMECGRRSERSPCRKVRC